MRNTLDAHDPAFGQWEQQIGYERDFDFTSARNRQFDQGLEMALAGVEAAVAALPEEDG
jgi:hypothetical protein